MALPPGIKARSGQLGVPTPFVAHVHPYPTRYHGGIWTRPEFGFPYVQSPQAVLKPDDFAPAAYQRYPWANKPTSGLGMTDNTKGALVLGAVVVAAGAGMLALWLLLEKQAKESRQRSWDRAVARAGLKKNGSRRKVARRRRHGRK